MTQSGTESQSSETPAENTSEDALDDVSPVRVICMLPSQTDMQEIDERIEAGLLGAADESDRLWCSVYRYSDFLMDNAGNVEDVIRVYQAMEGDFLILFGGLSLADGKESFAGNHVRLILLDNDVPQLEDERIGFIGSDNDQAVSLMADAIEQQVPDPDIAVFITHVHETTLGRTREITRIANQKQWNISQADQLPENSIVARQMVKQYLKAHPETNVLFCADGYSTNVVATLAEELEQDYYLTGFDPSEEVLSSEIKSTMDTKHYGTGSSVRQPDRQAMIVMQDYEQIGREAIQFIQDYLAGVRDPVRLISFNVLSTEEERAQP